MKQNIVMFCAFGLCIIAAKMIIFGLVGYSSKKLPLNSFSTSFFWKQAVITMILAVNIVLTYLAFLSYNNATNVSASSYLHAGLKLTEIQTVVMIILCYAFANVFFTVGFATGQAPLNTYASWDFFFGFLAVLTMHLVRGNMIYNWKQMSVSIVIMLLIFSIPYLEEKTDDGNQSAQLETQKK